MENVIFCAVKLESADIFIKIIANLVSIIFLKTSLN